MRIKSVKNSLVLVALVLTVLLLLAGVLLQTAFFHVNPIKLGYNRFDFGNCTIFSKGGSVRAEYEDLEAALVQNESTHQLHYRAKIQLILCGSQSEINRYQPFVNRVDRQNAGAFAPWPNTVYITPKMKKKYGTLRGVLVHELSHLLLIQNYGIFKCYSLWKRSEWIPEGFAVYLAKWPIYFPRDRLLENAAKAGIDMKNGRLLGSKHAGEVPLPTRFMVYYYFIDYLYKQNNADSVIRFLKRACDNPRGVEKAFRESFHDSFSEYVKAFMTDLSKE